MAKDFFISLNYVLVQSQENLDSTLFLVYPEDIGVEELEKALSLIKAAPVIASYRPGGLLTEATIVWDGEILCMDWADLESYPSNLIQQGIKLLLLESLRREIAELKARRDN